MVSALVETLSEMSKRLTMIAQFHLVLYFHRLTIIWLTRYVADVVRPLLRFACLPALQPNEWGTAPPQNEQHLKWALTGRDKQARARNVKPRNLATKKFEAMQQL